MGYHPGFEDDGVYLSAVKADLNPALYPHDADFFRLQVQATVFDRFMAGFAGFTHLPVDWAELLWQFLSLYTILWAGWRIAQKLFPERRAQWAAMALLAAMFTLPVAGTAVNLADQHLHPRTMATALILLAVNAALAGRLWRAAGLLFLAFVFHPIMAAFGISFCAFLVVVMTDSIYLRLTSPARATAVAAAFPLGWILEAPTPAWRRALDTRTYYFLYQWTWYEWLGAIGPLVIFWILWKRERRREGHRTGAIGSRKVNVLVRRGKTTAGPSTPRRSGASLRMTMQESMPEEVCADAQGTNLLARFSFAIVLYGVFQQGVAMVLLAPSALVRVTPLQPMRYLHLVYVFLVIIGGGLLGRHVLGRRAWRWALVLLPAYGGMYVSQRVLLPASDHLELPGRVSGNPWVEAFAWIRENTPADAYFALDPHYLAAAGEDYHSFRALAERSQLADAIKDAAVVTQVPELGPRWVEQVDAQDGWSRFQMADFERLKAKFGVGWVLVPYPAPARLNCIWHNDRLSVCRIPGPGSALVH